MIARSNNTPASLALVTLISVMIWLWAAGETRENLERSATIFVKAADPLRFVVQPSKPRPVTLRLSGSKGALESSMKELSAPIALDTGSTGVPNSLGEQSVRLVDALNAHPIFADSAVTVESADPPFLEIRIDESVEVEAAVEPVLGGVKLQGKATVEPAKVTLRMPSRLREQFSSVKINAVVDPQQLSALPQGQPQTLIGQWRLPAALAASADDVSLPEVMPHISFTLESKVATTTVPRIPVQIAGVAEDLEDYIVSINENDAFLKDVILTGPVEQIRRIEAAADDVKIVAFVHLTSNDLALHVTQKPIGLWMLPDGVVATPASGTPMIRLAIVDRPVESVP